MTGSIHDYTSIPTGILFEVLRIGCGYILGREKGTL